MCAQCNKIRVILQEIEEDCIELVKKGDLNEYGEGQRHLAIGLLTQLKQTKDSKYTINDIKSATHEENEAQALLLIANELRLIRNIFSENKR